MHGGTKKKTKRGRKRFDRYVFLLKLAEAGEIVTEELLNSAYHMFIKPMFNQTIVGAMRMDSPVKLNWKEHVAWNTFLSRLKKEQLIKTDSKRGIIAITRKGLSFVKNKPFFQRRIYRAIKNQDSDEIILVIYDIPENKRIWRDWLRFQLTNFDFALLQQSVWSGNNILPQEFVDDLKRFDLLSYVHILSVNKKGTLSPWMR
jgi:hypothetical protein